MHTINRGQISFSVKAQNNHKSFVLGHRMGIGISCTVVNLQDYLTIK